MKHFIWLSLILATTARAGLEVHADYDLPNGAHKSANLFLVEKALDDGSWVALPGTPNYKVEVQTKRHHQQVDFRFRLKEKNGGREKIVASPGIRAPLNKSAEISQGSAQSHNRFHVRVTSSQMDG